MNKCAFWVLVTAALLGATGCSVFNECEYQQARCAENALQVCDCDGAGGGQLFTGCKSSTRWETVAWACGDGDICIEDFGGAVCVPANEGDCTVPGYVGTCLDDQTQRTCVTYFGKGVPLVGETTPGVVATLACREGESCESGDGWAGCVTPVGG